jgi:hypothetical protein
MEFTTENVFEFLANLELCDGNSVSNELNSVLQNINMVMFIQIVTMWLTLINTTKVNLCYIYDTQRFSSVVVKLMSDK